MEPARAHLARELQRLDVLLRREVLRLRARYQLSLDELRGLYVSDQQVDDLLTQPPVSTDAVDLTLAADAIRRRNRDLLAPDGEWRAIADTLALGALEEDLVVLALAPELDPKYERLFAYL